MSGASVSTHQRIERQLLREPANLPRALERQIAAEAEMHALVDIRLSLLETAVESMRDAAMNLMPPQSLDHLVLRFAHVANHRQIEFARELQLIVIEELLARIVETVDEIIEPDLADTDKQRIVQTRLDLHAQQVEIVVRGARREERMNAERICAAFDAMRQLAHRREVLRGRSPESRYAPTPA